MTDQATHYVRPDVQAFLGFPATGQLTEYERTILVTAYQRGLAGGPVIQQTVAASPWGNGVAMLWSMPAMSCIE